MSRRKLSINEKEKEASLVMLAGLGVFLAGILALNLGIMAAGVAVMLAGVVLDRRAMHCPRCGMYLGRYPTEECCKNCGAAIDRDKPEEDEDGEP